MIRLDLGGQRKTPRPCVAVRDMFMLPGGVGFTYEMSNVPALFVIPQ